MEHILIIREGFREEVEQNMCTFEKWTDQELVEEYNRQVKIGIVGVYKQAVYLVSMRYAFLARFQKSPVLITDGIVLKLTEAVKLEHQELLYLNNEPVP